MHTEGVKKSIAGDRVFVQSPRQFIGNMGILDPREQQSENRGGIPENCRIDPTPQAEQSSSQCPAAALRLAGR